MTSKRSSRVFVDDESHSQDDTQNKSAASSYCSRRNSRSSGREEFMQAAQEAEEGQRPQNDLAVVKDTAKTGLCKAAEAEVNGLSMASTMMQGRDFPPAPLHGRPSNFGVVLPGVYRSSYPKPEDFAFLAGLKLKTVVTLVKKDEMDYDLARFVVHNGINHIIFNMKGTKKEAIPDATMKGILDVVLDSHNYPLMLHCNHGKHRTGCVVGVMRKLAGWDGQRVLDEYRAYAEPKIRECDVEYIKNFQASSLRRNPVTSGVIVRCSRFSPGQVRTFSRALMVSGFILFVWVLSGRRIMTSEMTVPRT